MSETKQILDSIIKDFSTDKFTRFFRAKNRQYRELNQDYLHFNDADFTNGIKLGEAEVDDGKLLICAFKVQKNLTERSGKKSQYEKAKNILKAAENQIYSAGIFIFYDVNENFRFSLVYPESLGTRRQWSHFKRFTYFVSQEFTNKTFLQRIGDGDFSSLDKIKEAFSVEKVTKEFYQDIANWYFWAVSQSKFPKDAEAEENGRNIAVIRLITRMIFIWFMRVRGLINQDLFEKQKIKNILKNLNNNESSYYMAILQNLFFATLSTKKEERQYNRGIRSHKGYNTKFDNQYVFHYQEMFKNPDKIKDYFGNIPFLNGGLFECLDDEKNGIIIDGFSQTIKNRPYVPNLLFFGEEQRTDLNEAYGTKNKIYKVRGLLDILSSFNFTIDENAPDDADIALDPELLGRVFENLLASFNPETSTTARKATGSYYTPREVVNYMVDESLKAYFKTHLQTIEDIDKKIEQLFRNEVLENPFNIIESKQVVELIENVKIIDPAVGSGAFPMGVLNKLVFILNKIDTDNKFWKEAQLKAVDSIPDPSARRMVKERIGEFFESKNADYGRKLYLIQRCIYGVDIQQIAVEIAKLRFFISLLVDEKIDKAKNNWGIEPLPNLDFKIMQGNSLISEFLGVNFDNGNYEKAQVQVSSLFVEDDNTLIKKFEQKKIDFQNESDKDKKADLKQDIEDLMIQIFEIRVKKQKGDYFKRIEEIEKKYSILPNQKQREEIIAQEKQRFFKKTDFDLDNIEKQLREFASKKITCPFFPWKLYFAEVFDKGGFDIVIANPPYNAELSNEERLYFKNEYESVKTGRQDTAAIFVERAKQIGNNNMQFAYILPYRLFSRKRNHGQFQIYVLNNFSIKNIIYLGSEVDFSANDEFMILTMSSCWTEDNKIRIAFKPVLNSLNTKDIYKEIPQKKFIERGEINLNLVKYDLTLIRKIEKSTIPLKTICEVKDGIVPYIREQLIEENKLDERYVKFAGIAGKYTLQKFFFNYTPLYLCYDINEAKKHIKDKLELRKVQLRERNIFLHRKIVSSQNSSILKASIDENKIFVSNSIHSTYLKDEYKGEYALEYILALFNSNLINYYHNFLRLKATDLHPQILINDLKKIPIKKISQIKQQPFITLVNQIYAITKTADYSNSPVKKEKVKEYEEQIDELVYKLYELTPREIDIVKGEKQ